MLQISDPRNVPSCLYLVFCQVHSSYCLCRVLSHTHKPWNKISIEFAQPHSFTHLVYKQIMFKQDLFCTKSATLFVKSLWDSKNSNDLSHSQILSKHLHWQSIPKTSLRVLACRAITQFTWHPFSGNFSQLHPWHRFNTHTSLTRIDAKPLTVNHPTSMGLVLQSEAEPCRQCGAKRLAWLLSQGEGYKSPCSLGEMQNNN